MAHELNIPAGTPAILRNASLDTPEIWEARVDLAACLRSAARLGLEEGICNHFSALVPGHSDLFLVNRLGWAFQEATASSLLICDFDGHVVAGDGVPRRRRSSSTPACTRCCRASALPSTPICRMPPRSAWSRANRWSGLARPR